MENFTFNFDLTIFLTQIIMVMFIKPKDDEVLDCESILLSGVKSCRQL